MNEYINRTYIDPAVGLKMRAMLGIELGRKWHAISPKIYRSTQFYLEAKKAERLAPKPRERRLRYMATIQSIDFVLRVVDEDQGNELAMSSRSQSALAQELLNLRKRLVGIVEALVGLRGRQPKYALRILVRGAALLLFLYRDNRKLPKHREHHAFSRLMLQAAGVANPAAGLADTCKDELVSMKRQGIFGEKRRKLLSYLP